MKRIVLFVLTNLAVLVVLSIVLRVLGLDRALAQEGLAVGPLLAFSAVVGFTGAIISTCYRGSTRNGNMPSPTWKKSALHCCRKEEGL